MEQFYKKLLFLLLLLPQIEVFAQTTTFTAPNNTCSSAPNVGTIGPATNCNNIGGIGLPSWQTTVNMTGSTRSTETNMPSCNTFPGSAFGASSTDVWYRFTTDANTDAILIQTSNASYTCSATGPCQNIGNTGNTQLAGAQMSLYARTSCPSGSAPAAISGACDNVQIISHGSAAGPFTTQSGIRIDVNPNTTYYVRIYVPFSSQTNRFRFDLRMTPIPFPPSNGNGLPSCATSPTFSSSTSGCNYGALDPGHADFSSAIPSCWGSVENSLFYQVVRPAGSSFSISINGVACEGGANDMQAALFRSCADIPLAGPRANQLACAVGTGTVTLNITNADPPGTVYLLWLDGNAGAVCRFTANVNSPFLPIELSQFNAKKEGTKVLLNWETSSEINNAFFGIERSSNGIEFEELAQVAGAGNSSEPLYYKAEDLSPLSGISYYRLRQVDTDGSFSYSKIIALEDFRNNSELNIYPNPTKELLHLQVSATLVGQPFQIVNTLGQVLGSGNIDAEYNQLNVSNLSSCLYLLIINGGEFKKSFLVSE